MDGAGFSPRDVAKLKVLLDYKVQKSVKPTQHPCPRCKKGLRARNYANIAGFFVEQCPGGCGLWVRQGDLDRIRILRSLGRFEEVKIRKSKPAAKVPQKAPAPSPARKGKKKKKKRKKKPAPAVTKEEPEPEVAEESERAEKQPGFLARLIARLFGKRN
jgi:Zn-finger nucleic acid-binding protein